MSPEGLLPGPAGSFWGLWGSQKVGDFRQEAAWRKMLAGG